MTPQENLKKLKKLKSTCIRHVFWALGCENRLRDCVIISGKYALKELIKCERLSDF